MDSYFHFQLIYDFVFFRYVSSQPWQHRIGSSLRSGFAHLDPLCLVAGGTVGGLKGRCGGHVGGAAGLPRLGDCDHNRGVFSPLGGVLDAGVWLFWGLEEPEGVWGKELTGATLGAW